MTGNDRPSESAVPAFRAAYAPADEDLAAAFLKAAPLSAGGRGAHRRARRRALSRRSGRTRGGVGGIEDFLREYSLSTKEGLALMVLAEALLRVPDAATADRLIEDKLSAGDFAAHEVRSRRAAGLRLGLGARHFGAA